jgi:CRP-like cAMP-binding protein
MRDISEVTGKDNEGEVTLPIGEGVIASRLNLTPQHFSRILNDLTAQGLIVVEGRKVHIVDLERLRALD